MKYRVGDKVIIASFEVLKNLQKHPENAGNNSVVSDMLQYAGRRTTVSAITRDNMDYTLKIDRGAWGWTDAMIAEDEEARK